MTICIIESNPLNGPVLEAHPNELVYYPQGRLQEPFHYGYSAVAAVLLSEADVLSIQVGAGFLSIRVDSAKPEHRRVMNRIVEQVRANAG